MQRMCSLKSFSMRQRNHWAENGCYCKHNKEIPFVMNLHFFLNWYGKDTNW